jgi:hypothetical protein
MPNDGKGYSACIPIRLQGTFADAESATYGFVVEPIVLFGRIADELFDTMNKVCKVGAVPLPRFAVDDNEFHFLDFVLITLLLLGKRTNMQSIAVLIECKSKPSEAPLQEMRKSREIEGREEKLVYQSEKLLSFH